MTPDDRAPDLQTWAAGFPLAGHRSLSAEEITRVISLRARVLRQGLKWSLAGPGLFGLCLLGFSFGPTFEARWGFLTAGVFGALLFVTPLWGRAVVERLRLASCLKRDLLDGRVLQFRLPQPPVSADPEEQDPADLDGFIDTPADGDEGDKWRDAERAPRCLELLPHSHVRLREGARLHPDDVVEVIQTSPPPEGARVAAEWVGPPPAGRSGEPHLNTRELSPREAQELRQARSGLLTWPLLTSAVGTLFCAGLLLGGSHREPGGWGALLCPGTLTLAAWIWLTRSALMFHRLGRDVTGGRVVIARWPDEQSGELSPPLEILPASRIPWTYDGQPAPWRTGA